MRRKERGQAFVELLLVMPVLLIVVAGMVDVVFAFNDYLQMLDGARNGARDSANLNPYPNAISAYDTDTNCLTTNNFFRRTACNTQSFLKPIDIRIEAPPPYNGTTCIDRSVPADADKFINDIVISIFTTAVIDSGGTQTLELKRFDNNDYNGGNTRLVVDSDESGWSFMMDQYTSPNRRGMCSQFDSVTDIRPLLLGDTVVANSAPNTAYLLVEVFYRHYQLFDLPAFGDFIQNPVPLHAYAIFSLAAAEATPTPEP
jgi:hypothetical protein